MNISFQEKRMKLIGMVSVLLVALVATVSCSQRQTVSYDNSVKKALEQADLKDVTVTEDRDKNTITLGGKLHSEDAKQQAGQIAQAAAGNRIIVNQISVEPVGNETAAKRVESNVDDGIENNYKAALISKGLDKEHIRFDAKNGVLVLKGSVKTVNQRKEAEQVANNVPNVAQVVNEIQVRR
jgi:hyperosmotically inducible periplasmic protein